MVEMHPPPNFHAAAPASIPLSGPSIDYLPRDIETLINVSLLRQDQCQSTSCRAFRNLSNDCSALCSPRPRYAIRSSSLPEQLSITCPFSNELMISGQTYEPRQTAGVFPNTSAVSLIAATILCSSRRLLLRNLVAFSRESTRANERAGPRAKVFRTEIAAHHFLDVLVDMASCYHIGLPSPF